MKAKHFLILAITGLSVLSGCSREHKFPPDYWMQHRSEISANGGTCTISIGSNVAWTATIDAAATWCNIISGSVFTPDPQEDFNVKQRSEIILAAPMLPHTVTEGRSAVLTITGDGISGTCTVEQIAGIRVGDIIFARTNVDEFGTFSDNPASFGKLYQFNRTTAYDPTEPVGGIPPNWPSIYTSDHTDWLPANDPCPPGWQIPPRSGRIMNAFSNEFGAGRKWVNIEDDFLIAGFLCGHSMATATWDDMKDCIYIPAISGRTADGAFDAHNFNVRGFYWTQDGSTRWTNDFGDVLSFFENEEKEGIGSIRSNAKNKGAAFPIRCIKK
jgi:hypothetical protein